MTHQAYPIYKNIKTRYFNSIFKNKLMINYFLILLIHQIWTKSLNLIRKKSLLQIQVYNKNLNIIILITLTPK